MAPPMSSASTRSSRFSMTSSLSETLAPPRIATNGRSGDPSALPRYSTSSAIRKPAAASLTWCTMPSVDACARCADPNASFTYTSASEASAAANAGSFFSSSAWKRRFSSRITPPRIGRDHVGGRRPDAVGRERHRPMDELRQVLGDGLERELRIRLALRPAEVRREDDRRAVVERVGDRRQRRADPRVVRDAPVLDRHVEVHAHEHAPVGQGEILDRSHTLSSSLVRASAGSSSFRRSIVPVVPDRLSRVPSSPCSE